MKLSQQKLVVSLQQLPLDKNRIPKINNGGELLTSILAEVNALDQNKTKINPIKRDFKFMI